jgi:hypothetical protein
MVECPEHQRSVKVLSVRKTSGVVHVEILVSVTPPCNVGRRLAWGNLRFADQPPVIREPISH